ncbi:MULTISPECIES: hypothetical protein [unclassified Nonomuraea]
MTNYRISLLGGHKGQISSDTVVVTPIGGADVRATSGLTLTKVALFGGVRLRVPADARVEIEGFSLFGDRHIAPGVPSAGGPLIRVRSYGVIGGVRVTRDDSPPGSPT